MKVVISAGGRFHAHQLANQLIKRNALGAFFTFDYTSVDRKKIPPHYVHCIKRCKIMNDAFVALQLGRVWDKSRFNVFKDTMFDRCVSKQLNWVEPFDLFVGWAHYSGHSIPAARKAGARIIIESGSCHIQVQQKLLQQEYERWGVPFQPIHAQTVEKMINEYNQADYIMTLSSFAHDSFITQGFVPTKVLKVPCGMNVEYFSDDKNYIQKKDKFRVIFVGLVTLRKGIHYLLQAWHELHLPLKDTELVIVGALQKDFAAIKQNLPIDSNIIFVGPVSRERLKALYQQSSLFVLPSIEDGFGMVIGEAMASKLPVVCTTNTAAPEIIIDGLHGFLVPPQSIDMLAEKIQWCYQHQEEASEMGLLGYERIQDFTWDVYGQNVYNVYEGLL